MSQIITHWKCAHCGTEFNQYFSFGHPNKAFDFKWACGKCGETNTQRIEAKQTIPPEIVAQLKKAGYKVKEISNGQKRKKDKPAPQGTDRGGHQTCQAGA